MNRINVALLAVCVGLAFGIVGCSGEDESATEAINRVAGSVEAGIADTADAVGEGVEQVADSANELAEDVGEMADDAVDGAKKTAKATGDATEDWTN